MASVKVSSAPCGIVAMSVRPCVASLSVRKASFFGPSLKAQRAPSGAFIRAREAMKVEARAATKGGQIQVWRVPHYTPFV